MENYCPISMFYILLFIGHLVMGMTMIVTVMLDDWSCMENVRKILFGLSIGYIQADFFSAAAAIAGLKSMVSRIIQIFSG